MSTSQKIHIPGTGFRRLGETTSVDVVRDINGEVHYGMLNISTGTAATEALILGEDFTDVNKYGALSYFNSGYTGTLYQPAESMLLRSGGNDGLTLQASNATGTIKFVTGGLNDASALKLTIAANGDISTADTVFYYNNTTKNLRLLAFGATNTPLTVKAAAAQTANLLSLQNSAATVLSSFNKDGILTTPTNQTNRTSFINSLHGTAGIEIYPIHSDGRTSIRHITSTASQITFWHTGVVEIANPLFNGSVVIPANTKWGNGWSGNSNNLVQAQSSASGSNAILYFYPERYADATANGQPQLKILAKKITLGTKSANSYLLLSILETFVLDETGLITITCATASTKGLVVKGAASQTANLTEWQDSAGTILTNISATGAIQTTSVLQLGNFGDKTMLWSPAMGKLRLSDSNTGTVGIQLDFTGNSLSVKDTTGATAAPIVCSALTASSDIEVTNSSKGLVLKSPDGTRWRVTISDLGVLTTASI